MNLAFIGKEIQKRRKEKQLTQKELGEKIGKTESSIQKYEAGKTDISINLLYRIAEVLEVDIYSLMDDMSVMEQLSNQDKAFYSFADELGYRFDFSSNDDYFYIFHNGYKYKISCHDLVYILDDIKLYSEYKLDKILEKYPKESL